MKKSFVCLCLLALTSLRAEDPAKENFTIISLEKEPSAQIVVTPAPSEKEAHEQIESFFEKETEDEVSAEFGVPSVLEEIEEDKPSFAPSAPEAETERLSSVTAHPIAPEEATELLDTDMVALEKEVNGPDLALPSITIDFAQVFSGAPTIYSLLIALSVGSFCIWLYTFLSLRTSVLAPKQAVSLLKEKLSRHEFDEALSLCHNNSSVLFKMVASALPQKNQGETVLFDLMKTEGKRITATLWQKIALLNDVAIIAPMIGLLGTVLGMFYAFYDLNSSTESISALFDGLGISVGTTVCGLLVAILAMAFHALTRYHLMKQLILVESEAKSIATLMQQQRHSS